MRRRLCSAGRWKGRVGGSYKCSSQLSGSTQSERGCDGWSEEKILQEHKRNLFSGGPSSCSTDQSLRHSQETLSHKTTQTEVNMISFGECCISFLLNGIGNLCSAKSESKLWILKHTQFTMSGSLATSKPRKPHGMQTLPQPQKRGVSRAARVLNSRRCLS